MVYVYDLETFTTLVQYKPWNMITLSLVYDFLEVKKFYKCFPRFADSITSASLGCENVRSLETSVVHEVEEKRSGAR